MLDLPEARYWIDRRAAPVIVQAAITIMLAVLSVNADVPLIVVSAISMVAGVAIVWEWWGIAKRLHETDTRNAAIAAVLGQVNRLIYRQTNTPDEVEPFKAKFTNALLQWERELKACLSAAEIEAVFNGPYDRVYTGPISDQEYRNMMSALFMYSRRLSELAMAGE